MSEKITKKIIVFNNSMVLKARKLMTVATFIGNQINKIPEEFRPIATWSMSSPSPNGEVNLVIAYKRLETDEENSARDKADVVIAEEAHVKLVEEATTLAAEYPGILEVVHNV